MPTKRFFLTFLVVVSSIFALPAARYYQSSAQETGLKVVYAGRLIDGTSSTVRSNVSVIIERDRIKEVREGRANVPGAEVIDLGDSTLMPGLIDAHTHLSMQISRETSNPAYGLMRRPSYVALNATQYTRVTLMAGFTTVRDVGANEFVDLSLRDAIAAGVVVGPRMFVAGKALSITGGHGDTGGLREDVLPEPDWRHGIVNSPEDGVRAVRFMVKYGVDLIKIAA